MYVRGVGEEVVGDEENGGKKGLGMEHLGARNVEKVALVGGA